MVASNRFVSLIECYSSYFYLVLIDYSGSPTNPVHVKEIIKPKTSSFCTLLTSSALNLSPSARFSWCRESRLIYESSTPNALDQIYVKCTPTFLGTRQTRGGREEHLIFLRTNSLRPAPLSSPSRNQNALVKSSWLWSVAAHTKRHSESELSFAKDVIDKTADATRRSADIKEQYFMWSNGRRPQSNLIPYIYFRCRILYGLSVSAVLVKPKAVLWLLDYERSQQPSQIFSSYIVNYTQYWGLHRPQKHLQKRQSQDGALRFL